MLIKFIERKFMEPQRRMAALQHEELPLPGGETVFLGDSITAGGHWHEWFPGAAVVNRGIGGDTTTGVLARLDTAVQSPSKVFLLIGTNDIGMRHPGDVTFANARRIVEGIRRKVPEAALVIQSVMPRNAKYLDKITRLNGEYRALAAEFNAGYLDLWPVLSDGLGALRKEYTLDGLHLNGAGYKAWTEVLRPYV